MGHLLWWVQGSTSRRRVALISYVLFLHSSREIRLMITYNHFYWLILVLTSKMASLTNEEGRRKEMFYLTTHSTYFIYGYMASDIWLRTILIARKETRCRHIGYSFRLTARVLLYAPSHRQDITYHYPLLHQSWSTGWNEK